MSKLSRYHYKNGPNWYNFYPFSMISLALCSLGIYGYYKDSIINFLILAILISFFLFLALFIREFIRRPIYVDIDDNNIILNYRNKKKKNISWNEVIKIDIYKKGNTPIIGRMGEGGAIISSNYPGVSITYEIALVLTEIFHEKRKTVTTV